VSQLPEGWELSRPPTWLELLGLAASKWLGRLGAFVVLLVLVFAIVVGVPAFSVMRSDGYLVARNFIANSESVRIELQEDIESFARVPARYRMEPDRAELVFEVRGAEARGEASVTVSRSNDVWSVTSASFVVRAPREPGIHRRMVLVRGR
jgi:hypothetical protein